MRTTDRNLKFLGLRPYGDLGGLTCYTTRRRRTVWFVKAPPTCPPSVGQRMQRLRFVAAARAWQSLKPHQRERWNRAARAASLRLHGYNLWIHWEIVHHPPTIRTIEQQTGIQLI